MSSTTTPSVSQKISKVSPLQLITKHSFQPSGPASPTHQSSLARSSSVKKLYLKLPESPTHVAHSEESRHTSPRNLRKAPSMKKPVIHTDPLDRIRKMLKNKHRTPEEALLIYKFLSDTKFFKNFRENNSELHETDALIHICQHIGYEQLPARKVVFQEGDQANGKMYIIFKGDVNVMARRAGHHPRPFHQAAKTTEFSGKTLPKQIEISLEASDKTPSPNEKILSPQSKTPRKRFNYSRTVSFDKSPINRLDTKDLDITSPFQSQQPTAPLQKLFIVNFPGAGSISEENSPLLEPNSPKTPKSPRSPKGGIVKLQKISNEATPRNNSEKPVALQKEESIKIFKTVSNKLISSIQNLNHPGRHSPPQLSSCQTIEAILDDEEEQLQRFADRYGTVINKLKNGDFFGELALSSNERRTASIITTSHCEFITISAELYYHMRKRYEKTNTKKFNFIIDYFPDINPNHNKGFAHDLLYLSQETPFEINSYITVQDQPCKIFYILYEGVCNLYLKIPDDPLYKKLQHYGNQGDQNKNDGILVCKIQPGMFIGEEILFNFTGKAEFTVKAASSDVILLAMDPIQLKKRLPKTTIKAIEEAYLFKHNHHFSHASERAKLKSKMMPLMKPSLQKKFGTSVQTLTSLGPESLKPSLAFTSDTPMKKNQMNQYLRLGNLKSPQNQLNSPALSLSNVVRTLDTVRSRQDIVMSSRVFDEYSNKETPKPGNKWQFGDDERMPFRVQRMKKKSEGEIKVLRTEPSGPKLIPALKLKSGETLERQVITARLVTRVGKGKIRAEKKKWQKLSIPSGMSLEKSTPKIHMDIRQAIHTATLTEASDIMDSDRYPYQQGAWTERSNRDSHHHHRNLSSKNGLRVPPLSIMRYDSFTDEGTATLENIESMNYLENSSSRLKSQFNLTMKNESGFGNSEFKRKIILKPSGKITGSVQTKSVPIEACYFMGLK